MTTEVELLTLEEYAARLPSKIAPHPLCGPATLSVGRIEGGISVNTVPDWCAVENTIGSVHASVSRIRRGTSANIRANA